MSKILLVQQYLGDNHEVGPIFPIGLAYIATRIESIGWQIRAIDLNIYESPYEELSALLKSFCPDVVALSLRNIDNVDYYDFNYFYQELRETTDIIKQYSPILVVGGAGFSIFAPEIMQQNDAINYGIVQEGEETIAELLECIQLNKTIENVEGLYYWKGNDLIFTGNRPPMDFSKSPIPNRAYFEVKKYLGPLCMGVQTKRGCSLKCSYCTYPFLNKHSERFRLAKDVVDEIELLIKDYGISEIIFCDDIFNFPLKHSVEIINEILKRKIHIKWSAWFDVASTDVEFMRLAISSGCYRFCFSTEGVTDRALKKLHKNFNALQANELIKLCHSVEFDKIDFRFSLFAMPPGQTFFGMLKTISTVFKTHVCKKNSKCLVSWIRILPNTELYNSMSQHASDLLPLEISKTTKKSLFYNDYSINWVIVCIYTAILRCILFMRRIRKVFWS